MNWIISWKGPFTKWNKRGQMIGVKAILAYNHATTKYKMQQGNRKPEPHPHQANK